MRVVSNTKNNRYYWMKWSGGKFNHGVDGIVWLCKNYFSSVDGWGANKDIFLDGEEKFIEIGMDCPYNQLMRQCRVPDTVFSCWGVDFIAKEQVN